MLFVNLKNSENGANERAVCLSFSLYQNEVPNGLKSLSVNLEKYLILIFLKISTIKIVAENLIWIL